jgi:hypothetical protein
MTVCRSCKKENIGEPREETYPCKKVLEVRCDISKHWPRCGRHLHEQMEVG